MGNMNNIGANVYKEIQIDGPPWSGATTALIAGLGSRLIYIAITHSKQSIQLSQEIQQLFTYCDDDDVLFAKYLRQETKELNQVAIHLINTILTVLDKTLSYKSKIKDNLIVDFEMGYRYLIVAAEETINIIDSNQNIGVSEIQLHDWKKKIHMYKGVIRR